MANYFIGYRGGERPATPEEGAAHMEKYMAWQAGLSGSVVMGDSPMMKVKIVSKAGTADNSDSDPLIGFMVITAADMDAAVAIAEDCPFLEMKGATMQVGEIMQMG